MTFARLDDHLDGHPKVRRVGFEAFGLWCAAIVHSSKYLTDGHIDREWFEEKVPQQKRRHQLLELLVENRMLEQNGVGYIVHDYLEHNPSRAEVEYRRTKAAEKKAAQRMSPRDTPGDSKGDDRGDW